MPTEAPAPSPPSESAVMDWLRLAAHPATVRRAFITAIIVGAILIAINYGAIILAGQLNRSCVLRMCLTVVVPYTVSTVSSVATRRELAKRQQGKIEKSTGN